MRLEKMERITRRKLLSMGLAQLDSAGLERLVAWEGPMLLDGKIYDDKTGHC